MTLSIVTCLWSGNTMPNTTVSYVADHVNRLYSAFQRNLTLPHRFICVTDMPAGIRSEVEIVPLWPDLRDLGRCYRRLKFFDPAMRDVLGPRMVSVDLDTVVTGNLDHLFDRPEPFVIWGDRHVTDIARRTAYCGSLFMLEIGYRPEIFHAFDPDVALTLRKTHGLIGSDQAWLSHKIEGAPTWGRKDGVYSFRFDVKCNFGQRMGFGRKKIQPRSGALPKNARIVFFHGPDDPSMTHLHPQHKWIHEHWR